MRFARFVRAAMQADQLIVQPRMGFDSLSEMRAGLKAVRDANALSIGTITLDSYTRVGEHQAAALAIQEHRGLNGYPIVVYGAEVTKAMLDGIQGDNFPIQVRHGCAKPLDIFQVIKDAGIDATEGGPVSYCLPYGRVPLAESIDAWATSVTFRYLSRRSNQVANWLAYRGVCRGDRVFLLLGNSIPLYEIILACMKLGAVVIPGFLSLSRDELSRRIHLGGIKFLLHSNPELVAATELPTTVSPCYIDSAPKDPPFSKETSTFPDVYMPARHTLSSEPVFGYFTSGTTSDPKLVIHSHSSYPIGHLSSMYWNGVRPGDIHFNVSAPGWAKHTWGSFFVPWNAEATVVSLEQASVSTDALLDIMRRKRVTSFCAPPSTWRSLVRGGLGKQPPALREITAAGEALDFVLVEAIHRSWGLWLRDGYGQTETTAQIGHAPGTIPKPGTLGKPLPGYEITLIDPLTGQCGDEGEISIPLNTKPVGLMLGYESGQEGGLIRPEGRFYRTGDLAYRDSEGYIVLQGRIDDLFKCKDHRISPFELEKILLQHPNIAEAVVVPFLDKIAGTVPKAYIKLALDIPGTSCIAHDLFTYLELRISPDFRIHRIQFIDAIPKTQSGKILRRALREPDTDRKSSEPKPREFLWRPDALPEPSADKVICHA